ncbi:MAG: hypothetical protein IT423_18755 [Pirellulaceae bacterium]|nr:hypothetical protein [Pirellulaceae bacterium]
MQRSRRRFFSEVGQGMLLAGLGSGLAGELGIQCLQAQESDQSLDFGELEPLVCLMQETGPDELTAELIKRLARGTELKTLVAAGALANARTFAGQDYIGFHTFMALMPAYKMSQALPTNLRALPVLKVLYRNAQRIQELGGREHELLQPLTPEAIPNEAQAGDYLRQVSRTGDVERADRTFASLQGGPIGEAFHHLQYAVEDEVDVHRVVLAWRAWDTYELTGEKWAHCLLRQSIRYCANTEKQMIAGNRSPSTIRTVLPALLDQYHLLGLKPGTKKGDDHWIDELAQTIFRGSRDQAADAVAQALAEGYDHSAVGEALSIAANRLVLHDPGRPEKWSNAEKPVGSCHGDSVGVHASDAANAWRNIASVSDARNAVASLIVGAFHTGGQSDRSQVQAYPLAEHLEQVRTQKPLELLKETEAAICAKDQFLAAALIQRYGELGHPVLPAFELMLKFATSEDGALHAEKYYHTVTTEFANTRPAYRWNQVVALARVTASEYGRPSPGYQRARELMG